MFHRKLVLIASVVCCILQLPPARSAEWKPANGPLMTRWARDVSPTKAHREYPRPQMVRRAWMSLNGLWQLALAKEGEAAPLGKTLSQQILVPFPIEAALSGVMQRTDRAWYRRTFEAPQSWSGQRVLLHFGAVDWEATVYVNGKNLGTHRGGYDGFSHDITDALKPDGPQELVVGVFDPTDRADQPRGKQVNKPGGIFYTPTTGIWQSVWLEPVPQTYINRLVMTPDVDAGQLRLKVEVNGGGNANLKVHAVAQEGGRPVGSATGGVGTEIMIPVPNARLWWPDIPFLYGLRVALQQGGRTVDSVDSYFGMRKVSIGQVDGVTRLLLNGKFVFQMGPLDQGFWPDGLYTAPTDEALRSDIEITRQLGFNMIRKHVKVEPARWYYWADRLGLLVWQDMPSGNNKSDDGKKQFELELREMIEERRNHPSIILWVVFNEGWGQHDTERITKWVQEFDPSRLVNNASGWTDKKVGDVIDMHRYPGPGSPQPEPQRAAVLGEFGGLGLPVEGHMWSQQAWGYRGTTGPEQLTSDYVKLLTRVWQFKSKPGLSAAVYTQTTDVETEANGLLTYDREVVKVNREKVAQANRGDLPQVQIKPLVPTSQQEGLNWRYTTEKPEGDAWTKPDFNDAGWKQGPAGFGTPSTPGAVVRTLWNTPDIWLRRTFEMPQDMQHIVKNKAWEYSGGSLHLDLAFWAHHDEDVEIYINGVLAATAKGYTHEYEELAMTPEGKVALKPGKNLIAVHCKQTGGGQYIDVGIVEIAEIKTPIRTGIGSLMVPSRR
ncbi:MAG: glycoside hydrolase family 2 [Armatimonadota bacterium]|nr:glycoside hydrolase family 2 [Armatimonadota bacterium]